jgi:hypothetical protein
VTALPVSGIQWQPHNHGDMRITNGIKDHKILSPECERVNVYVVWLQSPTLRFCSSASDLPPNIGYSWSLHLLPSLHP